MPTSSGASSSLYGTTQYRSERLLNRRYTPPSNKVSTSRHYGNTYISSKPSVSERTSQMLSPSYHRDHDFKDFKSKIDINHNSLSAVRSTGSNSYSSPASYTTSSSTYGSYQKHPISVSSRLTNTSSRSNSVDSSYQISPAGHSHKSNLSYQNRNDSCSSYDSDGASGGSSQSDRGKVGLTNLGNTCFMNSMLQCLLNTKHLKDYITSSQLKLDINRTNSAMKGALMEEYVRLGRKVWDETKSTSVAPRELKNKVTEFAPRFGGYNQQDSQEFLRYFLQGLHEDVNRVKSKPKYIGCDEAAEEKMSDSQKAEEYWRRYINFDNSAIVDLFVGQLKSELICQTCGYRSVTFDPFWDLSLPIPKSRSGVDIKDCMESFMKEEILDGDERPTCAKCKVHRKCTKTFKIQRFPKILVLHLKRFSGERYRQKLQTRVNFDLRGLNLSKFSANSEKSLAYNIYGISNHVGSVYSGHYTAYCKNPNSHRWYSFNDSRVSSITDRDLVSEEAYVLFYELED